MLRDIVLWIKLKLNPGAAQQVQQQIQQSLNQGTNPAAATRNIGTIERALAGVGIAARRAGIALLAAFGGRQIVRFLEESVMMFARFDQKLQQSIAIMGEVDKAMRKQLGDTARTLAKELNLSADDLAGAYLYLASAGLDAQQSIAALPAIALFAKAGMMDLADATMFLAEANSVLGYRSTDAQKNLAGMVRIMDVLSKLGAESLGTIESLTEALTNKAGDSLRLFGKDVEEGAAALAVLADRGVQGRLAGERLDMFMRQATQAAIKHKEVFKAYGIEIFDSTGKMNNFADIADDLTKALGNLSDEQQVLALQQLGFQVRTVASVKAFIDQGDAIRKYETMARSASGFTRTVANEQMKTASEQWGLIKQKIDDARRSIGEALIPALMSLGEMMGDETDPSSIVSQLKAFAKWIGEHPDLINNTAKAIIFLVTKPLTWLVEIMGLLYDATVFLAGGGLFILSQAFVVLAGALWIMLKPLGMFVNFISGGFFHELDDIANGLEKVTLKVNELGKAAGKAALQSGRSFIHDLMNPTPLFGGGTGAAPKPRLTDTFDKGLPKGGRVGTDKTGKAIVMEDPEEVKKRNDQLAALNERLQRQIAAHTAERVDDEMAKLNELEADYRKIYGDKIPKAIADSFKELRSRIGTEGAAKQLKQQFEDLFSFHQKDDYNSENLKKVQDFADKIKTIRDATDENSKAWAEFNDLLNKTLELRDEIVERLNDKGEQEAADRERENQRIRAAQLERIRNIGESVAESLSDAFGRFTEVLVEGSRRGVDAFENLGRGMLAALMSPLAEYTMLKAKENFALSAEEAAAGIAALSNPFLSWTAPGHFLASAKYAGVGALWAAIGGSVGAGMSAITGNGHGLGNQRDTGRSKVDDSTRYGPDIHIHIDGVDPYNPRHQQLIGETIDEYRERTGGGVTINGKRQ